jgi:esterase/lipase superfamily enzyme
MIDYYYFEFFDDDEKMVFGRFVTEGVKQPIKEWNLSSLTAQQFENEIGTHFKNNELFLFIHGYWAEYAIFSRKCHAVFNKVFKNANQNPILIRLIWPANTFGYIKSWHAAAQKGRQIGHIIQWLSTLYTNKMSVMCHSMGGKFFEGVLTHFMDCTSPIFKRIILYSVDLDAHIFDTSFRKVALIARSVHIYHHKYDKTLGTSQILQQKKRLGVMGDLTRNLPHNVESIDMSKILWNIDFSRHSLFWTSVEVQNDFKNVLQDAYFVEENYRGVV